MTECADARRQHRDGAGREGVHFAGWSPLRTNQSVVVRSVLENVLQYSSTHVCGMDRERSIRPASRRVLPMHFIVDRSSAGPPSSAISPQKDNSSQVRRWQSPVRGTPLHQAVGGSERRSCQLKGGG